MKLNKGANNGLPHVVAWVLAVLAVGMLCWVTQHMVQAEWRERDQTARREVSNMSRLSQEHALRTLRAADQALQLVRALYLRDGDRLKLADWVNQGAIDVSVFHQVGIIDAKGIYRLSNLPETPLVDLSDREHFKAHLGQKGDVLFVSKPVLGRVSKKWTIQLTRPIMHADGRFGGVAVVSVDADYFASFYASLDLGKSGAAAMVGTDGVLRARRSSQPASTGSVMGISVKESPALKLMTNGVTEGFSENASPIDQVRRLHHFRMIEGYPLYVAVALGVDDYQAASRAAERQSWMMTALGCSLIFGLAGLFSWHWQREQRQRRVLMDSKAYTQLALDGGGIGVWEWDLQHNRFTLDARLWAMLGYVPGELDTTLQVFMAHVHPQDSARVRKLLTAVLKRRGTAFSIRTQVAAQRRPLGVADGTRAGG
jgi:PAS domain-containing protein